MTRIPICKKKKKKKKKRREERKGDWGSKTKEKRKVKIWSIVRRGLQKKKDAPMSVCDLKNRFDRCVCVESQGRWTRLELHWECVLYEDWRSSHLTSHEARWHHGSPYVKWRTTVGTGGAWMWHSQESRRSGVKVEYQADAFFLLGGTLPHGGIWLWHWHLNQFKFGRWVLKEPLWMCFSGQLFRIIAGSP